MAKTQEQRQNDLMEKQILAYKRAQKSRMLTEVEFIELEARANKASFEKMDYYKKCKEIASSYNKMVEEDMKKRAEEDEIEKLLNQSKDAGKEPETNS